MYHILFIFGTFSSLILAAGGLKINFSTQPIAAQNNTYTWTRESSDPADFFLQKIKIDGDNGPTSPSPPVAVPNVAAQGGEALMHFNRAGVFQIIAVNTQNPGSKNAFYSMFVTVQVNPTSSGAPQASGTSTPNASGGNDSDNSDNGKSKYGHWQGHDHGNNDGDNNKMMKADGSSSDSSDGSKSTTAQDIPKIVGIVLGVVAFMFLVTALLLYFRYRRRRRTNVFQRNMLVRSPGSVNPFAISQPMDVEKRNELSPSFFSQHQTTRYGDQPGRKTLSTVSDSIGTSVSQRRFNEPIEPRSRNSRTTSTTLTLESSGSGGTDSTGSGPVQFPIPTLPPRIRTSRQIMIEEDIQALQRKMLGLLERRDLKGVDAIERDEQIKEITERVDTLKKVHEGPWALRQTEVLPPGLFS